MIRLIQRRLIIPRGDTGSFTIPALGAADVNDIVVFSIFDPLTHRKIFQKRVTAIGQLINIVFSHNDTAALPAGKYVWDIKYYKNPIIEDDEIVDGEEVNSYYAGFSLPVCEIRETAEDWPIYQWLAEYDIGDIVKNIASIVLEDGYLILNFTDGTTYKTSSIRGEKGETGTTFIPSIDANGILSWDNTDGKENPPSINLIETVIASLPLWNSENYTITPSTLEQTLDTKGKFMQNDLTIKEIPYYEVSNTSGGNTVHIGS